MYDQQPTNDVSSTINSVADGEVNVCLLASSEQLDWFDDNGEEVVDVEQPKSALRIQ